MVLREWFRNNVNGDSYESESVLTACRLRLKCDEKFNCFSLDDATSQITALTNKVDGLSRGNGKSLLKYFNFSTQ